jgi:hypothetical protein
MTPLHDQSVQVARRDRLAKVIAAVTRLSVAAVRGRLARAHGRTLLRNLFADVWPKRVRGPVRPLSAPNTTKSPKRIRSAPSPERTIHRVRQEFSTSCGVAVVAMFARVSHAEAMAVLFPEPGRVFYTHLYQLKRALDHFGVPYGSRWSRFTSWAEIETTALVKVRWEDSDGRVGFHWVIFQRRTDGGWAVIDPDPQRSGTQRLGRTERAQFTGITYLPVEARLPTGVDESATRNGRGHPKRSR